MNDKWLETIEQIEVFLKGSASLEFSQQSQEEKYKWIQKVLIKHGYLRLKKHEKGVVKQYIGKVTNYSRAQITRLIRLYQKTGVLRKIKYERPKFRKKYTQKDIGLLAITDQLHELSGPAIKKILERELSYGHKEYASISEISVSHLYNLRKTKGYLLKNRYYSKTKPTPVNIGKRQKPIPNGQPGYIRIDTVHQGDLDKQKGVYHINAIDEVTQWEIVIAVEKISEAYLIPVIDEILKQFPFKIIGFHSDNGSEYINKTVAKLLNKLLIIFTKSRARKTNDNALVESKNGSIIRKHMGYAHIPQELAYLVNDFYRNYLNIYLNFHRPCFFSVERIDKKGKIKKKYPYEKLMTPLEKLKSITNSTKYLKLDITLEKLNCIANQLSDNQFAERMVTAKRNLWDNLLNRAA